MKIPATVRRYGKEAACVAGGCLLGYLLFSISGGKWVSTGNGRTILNRRTGEIRDSFTGEPILKNTTSQLEVEERDRLRRPAEMGKSNLDNALAQFQERRRSLGLPPLEISNDDRALWLLDAPEFTISEKIKHDRFGGVIAETLNGDSEESIQAQAAVEEEVAKRNAFRARLRSFDDAALAQELAKLKANGDAKLTEIANAFIASRADEARKAGIFKELQTVADEYVDVSYTNAVWKSATQPLRISDKLTPEEANRLLDALGQITGFDKYRTNESFKRAIKLVREYQSPTKTGSVDWWQIYDEAPEIGAAGTPKQGRMSLDELMASGRDRTGDDKESTVDEFGKILVDEADK